MSFGIHARKFIAFMAYPTLKTYGKPVRYFCTSAVGVGVIYCKTSNVNLAWKSSTDDFDVSTFMAEPVTDVEYLKKNKTDMKSKFELLILKIQADFCRALKNEEEGETNFIVDRWKSNEGGGGVDCVLRDGKVFEKAGVGVSIIRGVLPPQAVAQMKARGNMKVKAGEEVKFFSASINSVVYPRNPHVPTICFNYRYFEAETSDGQKEWWFGGDTDLLPAYLYTEDGRHYHGVLKRACDKHDKKFYQGFKKHLDAYHQVAHRAECLGIGGIFFDQMSEPSPNRVLRFVTTCAEAIVPSYIPIVQKRKHASYTDAERNWQLLRRGRIVEYKLVYDQGTSLGLHTNGARPESIFMTLPPYAKWEYMNQPVSGSKEEDNVFIFRNPIDWT